MVMSFRFTEKMEMREETQRVFTAEDVWKNEWRVFYFPIFFKAEPHLDFRFFSLFLNAEGIHVREWNPWP